MGPARQSIFKLQRELLNAYAFWKPDPVRIFRPKLVAICFGFLSYKYPTTPLYLPLLNPRKILSENRWISRRSPLPPPTLELGFELKPAVLVAPAFPVLPYPSPSSTSPPHPLLFPSQSRSREKLLAGVCAPSVLPSADCCQNGMPESRRRPPP
jgi:hypothetical protein